MKMTLSKPMLDALNEFNAAAQDMAVKGERSAVYYAAAHADPDNPRPTPIVPSVDAKFEEAANRYDQARGRLYDLLLQQQQRLRSASIRAAAVC